MLEWIIEKTALGKEYTICPKCKMSFNYEFDNGTFKPLDMRGCNFCPACGTKLNKIKED